MLGRRCGRVVRVLTTDAIGFGLQTARGQDLSKVLWLSLVPKGGEGGEEE